MDITRIVITGGPCAGKTTAMVRVKEAFTRLGYTVLFVPETATEFITGGVAPWTCGTNAEYQKVQFQLQLEKERLFEAAARTMPGEKILIVCDRGAMDNMAYMNDAERAEVLNFLGQNEVELRDRYDAVFHLVTAAKGAEQFYTTANNAARIESPAEAVALDDKLLASWVGHPHLRIIENDTDFEVKMRRLIREIASFLGEPQPYEIERKYLIEYPDIQSLRSMPNCRRVEIIQTYLRSENGDEVRVRQRGQDGHYVYFETAKRAVSGEKRIETERRISQNEYLRLIMYADPDCRPIRKDRYCLVVGSRYFEIDIYPFWSDRAILEIELTEEDENIELPGFLRVIREVTDEPEYKNGALAKR